jgi:hypothetical protein
MTRKRNYFEPLRHPDHRRPITRRDFIGQGFMAGTASVLGGGLLSLFADPRAAWATLSPDLDPLRSSCGINVLGAGKIPFICFDLAGGANMTGSNVLVGGPGGQLDFLSTQGYSKLGLPGDMIPSAIDPLTNLDFIDQSLGLAFHRDSAFLRGMMGSMSAGTAANVSGAVIPARSDNDTGNNPHNPLYGINRAGADGSLLTLIGSKNSDSGGNSMAPASMINAEARPTKVDRPSDVTGLVDTGQLVGLLGQDDAVAVMESIYRISDKKMQQVSTGLNFPDPNRAPITRDEVVEDLVKCGYLKSADTADRFGDPSTLNPNLDPDIVGAGGIFTDAEFSADDEFQKTAAVMKLTVNGFAGAGCVTMRGYDYHTGRRSDGEISDFRAGRCMGACLEYAARSNNGAGVPLMVYVFSDGSVSSNGALDNTLDGRGKGVWTSDNGSTAASFFLIYNPGGRPTLIGGTPEEQAIHQQIGFFRPDASVDTSATPAANNVNLLVETLLLNYMALHGEAGSFPTLFPNHGLGNAALRDSLTAFNPIVSGTI